MEPLEIEKIQQILYNEKRNFQNKLMNGYLDKIENSPKLSDDINRFKNILAFLFVVFGGGEGALYIFKKNPIQIIDYYKENIGDFNLVSANKLQDYIGGLHPTLIPYYYTYLVYYKLHLSLLSILEHVDNIKDENNEPGRS